MVTDRRLTLSDSISRYVIDLAEGLTKKNKLVIVCTTREVKREDYKFGLPIKIINGLPDPKLPGIWHFHLTFSLRRHTRFLFENIQILKDKSLVTLHVTPEYAKQMGQEKEMKFILENLSKHSVWITVFSNYAKYQLKKYGLEKIFVVYPGLNLNRYSKFLAAAKNKKKQILVVASNPDSTFVKKIKGFDLVEIIRKKLKAYQFEEVINLSFEEYLYKMAESQYYIALSAVEHYGFSIIDAFNLFTLPLYCNDGGLTEAVYGNGYPILVKNHKVLFPNKFEYCQSVVLNNFVFSQSQHSIEKHLKNLEFAYRLVLNGRK